MLFYFLLFQLKGDGHERVEMCDSFSDSERRKEKTRAPDEITCFWSRVRRSFYSRKPRPLTWWCRIISQSSPLFPRKVALHTVIGRSYIFLDLLARHICAYTFMDTPHDKGRVRMGLTKGPANRVHPADFTFFLFCYFRVWLWINN